MTFFDLHQVYVHYEGIGWCVATKTKALDDASRCCQSLSVLTCKFTIPEFINTRALYSSDLTYFAIGRSSQPFRGLEAGRRISDCDSSEDLREAEGA